MKVYKSVDDYLTDLRTVTDLEELRVSNIVALKERLQREGFSGLEYPNEIWSFERPELKDLGELAAPGKGTSDWWAKKESAMMSTREAFELDFTAYGQGNMVDAAMRTVFPFWTYESQRWFWLPRTFLKTPGTATSLGRYMDYSDQGYIPIPSTDIQFNPTRGSVFMGGFRRLYLRDFPEYYDAFPGMEVIDYIGRLGFYPGVHVMLPIVLFGAATGKPEFGELAPAWVKTTLDAARASTPML